MKLTNLIHSPLCAALLGAGALGLLSGCSAVYEDLDPCRNDAKVHLRFTRNMSGQDRYASDVHCARVLFYDAKGDFISSEVLTGGAADTKATLPKGAYHAIAIGGMDCEDASFGYNLTPDEQHNYFDLRSELGLTRVIAESASPLHPHFQSFADFDIEDLPNAHVPVEMDLTKNTNHIRILISYKDGFPIADGAFWATITADNAVIGLDGKIVKQETPVTYKPYDKGVETVSTEGKDSYLRLFQDFDIAKIDATDSPVLKIFSRDEGNKVVFEKPLVEILQTAKDKELPATSMEDYLDLQDNWTITFSDMIPDHGFAGAYVSVNGWEVVKVTIDLSGDNKSN